MNCIRCIRENLQNVVVAGDPEPVQFAVDGARTAVAVVNGESLCVSHLHQHFVNSALDGLQVR